MEPHSATIPTASWLSRFGLALVALFLAAIFVVMFCFFTGSEKNMEISFALMFPVPHLLALLWPFKTPQWSLAALQLVLYAATIAKIRRPLITTLLLLVIHAACIGLHLYFKWFVP
jgi:hypothetical protein